MSDVHLKLEIVIENPSYQGLNPIGWEFRVEQLQHNGVIVPPRYQGKGRTVTVNGEVVRLDDEQEEMAIAWARKVGTPYVENPVFAENFHADFSESWDWL